MLTLLIWFIISLIVLWIFVMFTLWRKGEATDVVKEINPMLDKLNRYFRKVWFQVLRFIAKTRERLTSVIAKIFFIIFPKARQAFEKREALLEVAPASDFLKSISEEIKMTKEVKNSRRKTKNV